MKKILVFSLTLFVILFDGLCAKAASNDVIDATNVTGKNKKMNAKIETRRIPKGSRLRIRLMDPISTDVSKEGDVFTAVLVSDENVGNSMILPAGTLMRGYIQKIKPARMLSRGAVIYLKIDHIVTTTGTQLSMNSIITNSDKMTVDGGLYQQSGYGDALKENFENTKGIIKKATNWGLEKDTPVNYFATPVGAVGGTIGGGAYLIGDSVIDIFRKGKDVSFNQDDIFEIVIMKDLDVPVI